MRLSYHYMPIFLLNFLHCGYFIYEIYMIHSYEIKKINERMKKGDEFLNGTQANYIMIRNLDGYKKALHNVLKEIDKLEKR